MIEPLAEAHRETLIDWKKYGCADALPQRVVNDPTFAPETVENPVLERFLEDRAENLRELDRYEIRRSGVYDRRRRRVFAMHHDEEFPRDVRECMRGVDFPQWNVGPPVRGPNPTP